MVSERSCPWMLLYLSCTDEGVGEGGSALPVALAPSVRERRRTFLRMAREASVGLRAHEQVPHIEEASQVSELVSAMDDSAEQQIERGEYDAPGHGLQVDALDELCDAVEVVLLVLVEAEDVDQGRHARTGLLAEVAVLEQGGTGFRSCAQGGSLLSERRCDAVGRRERGGRGRGRGQHGGWGRPR